MGRLNVLDLFCGCGGLSLGFENAGYNVILGIDSWSDALTTYAKNHKNSKTLNADLATLSPKDVEQEIEGQSIDVIIGGPPCQGFSVAGKRIVEDERNSLYKSFVRMVSYFKPKAFVLENVPNILSMGNGVIKEAILKDFETLGYTVKTKVLLASDFGVPQNRKRAIFVGLLNGKAFKYPDPCPEGRVSTWEAISDLTEDSLSDGSSYPCAPKSPYQEKMRKNSNLYKEVVRFLDVKKPKFFICENVKGLLTLQNGSIIQKIVREFSEKGYKVTYRLLRAVEYGIPQRRERVIIVGIRNDIDAEFTFPQAVCTESEYVPLSSVIKELAIKEKKYYFSDRAVEGMRNAKNNMKRGLWQDLSKPCLTITSHLAKTSINSRDPVLLVEKEPELYRRFTPREAAGIQSFPEDFVLNKSESKSYKQIGNAVPPVLMWYVAKALQDCAQSAK